VPLAVVLYYLPCNLQVSCCKLSVEECVQMTHVRKKKSRPQNALENASHHWSCDLMLLLWPGKLLTVSHPLMSMTCSPSS